MRRIPGDWRCSTPTCQDNLLHGDLVARVPVTRRFDLTDGQWALLEPLLPKGKEARSAAEMHKRHLIDETKLG